MPVAEVCRKHGTTTRLIDLFTSRRTKVMAVSLQILRIVDMKTTRFTDEQVIGFLKQAEVGMSNKELFGICGFSQTTFNKWRSKFGGMPGFKCIQIQRSRILEH